MTEDEKVQIINNTPAPEDRDRRRHLEEAGKVKSMIESPGWKEVVEPALQRAKDNIPVELKKAKTLEDFIKVQQGLTAIDFLFTIIKVTLAEGKRAEEEIESE